MVLTFSRNWTITPSDARNPRLFCQQIGARETEEAIRRRVSCPRPEYSNHLSECAHVAQVEPGTLAAIGKTRIRIGELEVDLRTAETWEPCPDWEALRSQRAVIASHTAFLRALCLSYTSSGSLLPLLGTMPAGNMSARAILRSAQGAAETLIEGCRGDSAQLREGATRLAGLGSGQ